MSMILCSGETPREVVATLRWISGYVCDIYDRPVFTMCSLKNLAKSVFFIVWNSLVVVLFGYSFPDWFITV